MGIYKRLLTLAEEGNRDAIAKVALHYRERGDLKAAIYWYGKVGKAKEIEELKALRSALLEDAMICQCGYIRVDSGCPNNCGFVPVPEDEDIFA